jgi:hypothetical protein
MQNRFSSAVSTQYRNAAGIFRRRTRLALAATGVGAVAVSGVGAGLAAGLSGPGAAHASAATTARVQGTQVRHATLTGHATPAKTGTSQRASKKAATASARPYSMYDSTTPSAIPSGQPAASYVNGSYAASPSQMNGHSVVWIDTNGSAPAKASALDVEPGDATPAGAATWAKARLAANPHAVVRIYTMLSQWSAAKAAIATLPGSMQSHVKWWIADPTGVQHNVPGADATQWYWGPNYDISTVNPGF